ncbi:MAG: cytochrome c maturation protein CcmE [Vicinamibacterales bacterium]
MKHKALKVGLTVGVLAMSFFGLMYTTMAESTEYYKHVDEVMDAPGDWYGKPLQLHGFVKPQSIFKKRNSMEYRFEVQSQGHVVQASYTGIVPDTFKDDAEVVLKGVLGPDGFQVHPNGVMAKCPSKYEAKVGAAGAAAAAARPSGTN